MAISVRRIQVPLDKEAEGLISALRSPSNPARESLRSILGEIPFSEAGIASRLISLGAHQVRLAQRLAGYAALAESFVSDVDEQGYEKAAATHRRRQAAAWADA